MLELPQNGQPDHRSCQHSVQYVRDLHALEVLVELLDNLEHSLVLLRARERLCVDKGLPFDLGEDVQRLLDKPAVLHIDVERVPARSARRNALPPADLNVVAPAFRAVRHIEHGVPRAGHSVEDAVLASLGARREDVLADHGAVCVGADVPLVDDEEYRDVFEKRLPHLDLEGLDPRPGAVDNVPHNVHTVLGVELRVGKELGGALYELCRVPLLQPFAVVDDDGRRGGLVALEVCRHGLSCALLSNFLPKHSVDQ